MSTTKVKKKKNSQKKGDTLEVVLQQMMKKVIVEWGFEPLEHRRQTAGTQFGKDGIYRWIDPKNKQEYTWCIEAKNYGNKDKNSLIPYEELASKAHGIYHSATQLQCWCIFSPFGYVNNTFREEIEMPNKYPFKTVLWTSCEPIDRRLACFPDLYKKMYGVDSVTLNQKSRKNILKVWRDETIKNTSEGQKLKDDFITKNISSQNSNDNHIDVDTANELEHKTIEHKIYKSETSSSSTKENIKQTTSGVEKVSVQEELDKGKGLLDKGNYPEAKEIYLHLLGKIENKTGYETELSKIHNNLGVIAWYENSLDSAISFFNKAINLDTNFVMAIKNLSAVYLEKSLQNKDKEIAVKELIKAEEIIKPLINGSETNPLVLQIWIKIINVKNGIKGLEDYLSQNEDELKPVLEKDDVLNFTLGHLFLESHNLEKAKLYAEKCIKLKESPEYFILRGRVSLGIALEKDTKAHQYSIDDISPEFIQNTNLNKASTDFFLAMELAQKGDIKILYGEISYLIKLVKTWLKEPVDENLLPKQPEFDKSSSVLGDQFLKVTDLFRQREYSSSYTELKSMAGFNNLPYEEILRFARTYLYHGQSEISLELFLKVEQEAEKRKDSIYFMDISMAYVLLEEKNNAIINAQKARDYSKDGNRKNAFSHSGAILLHYANEDGGDRLLENALQFDKEYPELHVVEPKKVDESLKEIIEMMKDRKKWVDNIKTIYRNNLIPSYFLQKTFKRPYVAVWAGRDPEMSIEFTTLEPEFQKELNKNFENCNTIVPDYLSLLTISKLDFLENLIRLGKKIKIPFSLFEKIQNELLQEENKELRKLWNFLRKSNKVEIIKTIDTDKFKNKKMDDLFEKWLIEELSLSKDKSTVFMTDDLRVLRFSRSEKIRPINSSIILQKVLEKGWIDRVMYSKSLGKLAECFYSFISFNGKDLFTIVADDHFKITPRSFYLTNQINKPGSDIRSFGIVFAQFIEEIWKPGFITEDKITWLDYLTNIFGELTQKATPVIPASQLDEKTLQLVQSSEYFGTMWSIAINKSSLKELNTLKKRFPKMIQQPAMAKVKVMLEEAIDKKITELKSKKQNNI